MNLTELLPVITQHDKGLEIPAVDPRNLHEFLQVETRFNDWFKRRITEYDFKEKVDFYPTYFYSNLSKNKREKGRPQEDYLISLSMAKELAMVERNEQARLATMYQNRYGRV